jgi:hypothetical protein
VSGAFSQAATSTSQRGAASSQSMASSTAGQRSERERAAGLASNVVAPARRASRGRGHSARRQWRCTCPRPAYALRRIPPSTAADVQVVGPRA